MNFSLPQLQLASQGHTICHLLSYSEYLPDKYEKLLLQSASQYPFLVLEKQKRGSSLVSVESLAHAELSKTDDPNQPFGIYRLDDDDILPVDYFTQNAPYVRSEYVGMQVSLGTGVTAIYKDGTFFNARKCYHPLLSIGYMSVHRIETDGKMTKFPVVPHSSADRHYPIILDSRKLGYLWTRHTEQDTILGLVETDEESRIASLKRHLDRQAPIYDMTELQTSFPKLDGRLSTAGDPSSTRQELINTPMSLSATGIHLKPNRVTGELTIVASLQCDMSSEPRSALLSFIFVDKSGLRVLPESIQTRIQGQGLSLSTNTRIGWFRYLATKPGKNRTEMHLNLPAGIYIGALRILNWRRPKTSITIQSVSLENKV